MPQQLKFNEEAGPVLRRRPQEMDALPDLKRYKILVVGRSELILKTGALLSDCGAYVEYVEGAEDARTLSRLTLPNAVVVSGADDAFYDVFTTAQLCGLAVVTFIENATCVSETVTFDAYRESALTFADATPADIVRAVSKHASPPTYQTVDVQTVKEGSSR